MSGVCQNAHDRGKRCHVRRGDRGRFRDRGDESRLAGGAGRRPAGHPAGPFAERARAEQRLTEGAGCPAGPGPGGGVPAGRRAAHPPHPPPPDRAGDRDAGARTREDGASPPRVDDCGGGRRRPGRRRGCRAGGAEARGPDAPHPALPPHAARLRALALLARRRADVRPRRPGRRRAGASGSRAPRALLAVARGAGRRRRPPPARARHPRPADAAARRRGSRAGRERGRSAAAAGRGARASRPQRPARARTGGGAGPTRGSRWPS